MSIEQKETVDLIGIEDSSGAIVLTIMDALEWKNNRHLLMLQEKLNTYFSFVESGEIFTSYPDAKDREIIIRLIYRYDPNEAGIHFLNQVFNIVEGTNMKFEYQKK